MRPSHDPVFEVLKGDPSFRYHVLAHYRIDALTTELAGEPIDAGMDRESGADRIETRELAYFVVVAETCHFGRAAQRLGITQPPLSRAISRLGRRLGVVLLERTSRRVALTVAGEVLLAEGRRALDTIDTAVARARTAARPQLRLALKPGGDGGLLAPILAAYRDEPRAVEVELVPCATGEQMGLLWRGAADVALVQGHQPDLDQLDSDVLLIEPQVVALAGDHPLAGAATLRLADVAATCFPPPASPSTRPRHCNSSR